MALCQDCTKRNICKDICNELKKEITGRGKTASRKPKTYLVDFAYIEDPHQCLNGFQRKVLDAIAKLSISTRKDLVQTIALEEAISVLKDNEKRVIELFMANYKQNDIAKIMRISQPRVNFLIKRALKKLKIFFLSQL